LPRFTQEAKKYTREAELYDNRLHKMCDSGKKANNLDTEIESLNRELAAMRKKKLQVSHHRNMDVRSMHDRVAQLTRERDRLTEDFARAVSEGDSIVKQFNEAKHKLLKSVNDASLAIDSKLKQKLQVFEKSLQDYLQLNRLYSRHLRVDHHQPPKNFDIHPIEDSSILLDSSKDFSEAQLPLEADLEHINHFATEGSFLLDAHSKDALVDLAAADSPQQRMVDSSHPADTRNPIRA
jgi:hypothetical protein